MLSNSVKTLIAVAVIIGGFAAIFVLSNHLEQIKPELPKGYADQDLALQGSKLKGFSFGAEGLLADWYWIQSLQYLGDKIVNSKEDINLENLSNLNPRLLYPYLNNSTDLDPQFMAVYEYGAVVLPAIDADQAIKFVEKGIANNPKEWWLYNHLGYIYWRQNNFKKAAEIYSQGAEIENAPPFMKLMAAKLITDGGTRETARTIYTQMRDKSVDKQVREVAELRLLELDSLDEREAISSTLEKFKAKNNRCANSFSEIFPLLQSIKLPNGKDFRIDKSNNLVDPTDVPYLIDKENCKAILDVEKTKLPLK
ncbi:hypothetical protein BH10ACI1_BH10ACI1_26280 [soil metagenome]